MRRRRLLLLGLCFVLPPLSGCAHASRDEGSTTVARLPQDEDDPVAATADALLSAWFGCGMGETWIAALETPPHTWATPTLARCHAVGRVVDAPAPRLRAFVPEAIAAVSRSLDRKLGPASGFTPQERRKALDLFLLGTSALQELTESLDAAREIARDESADGAAPNESAIEPSTMRARRFRMSQAGRLAELWEFGNGRAGMRSAQATALAWMIVLERVHRMRALPPELRTAYVALPLEAVAKVTRPEKWTGYDKTVEAPDAYLARALAEMGVSHATEPASERSLHAALVRAVAERLRAAAHPLPTSELRRAALGAADAFLRDTAELVAGDTM